MEIQRAVTIPFSQAFAPFSSSDFAPSYKENKIHSLTGKTNYSKSCYKKMIAQNIKNMDITSKLKDAFKVEIKGINQKSHNYFFICFSLSLVP